MDLCRFENILDFHLVWPFRVGWFTDCTFAWLRHLCQFWWTNGCYFIPKLLYWWHAFYFVSWDLVKEQHDNMKAFSNQKPPLDIVRLICTSKTNIFCYKSALSLVRAVPKKNQDISLYVFYFYVLVIPIIANIWKESQEKRLPLFCYTTFVSFELQHMYCMSTDIPWQ